jgi:ryanodine receptor 2
MNNNHFQQEIDSEDLKLLHEAMAKKVHEIWVKQRIAQGWTYGEIRDDTLKHHPCLVAYEDLPVEEKVYYLNTSVETLELLQEYEHEGTSSDVTMSRKD